jgi:hypothetical protein
VNLHETQDIDGAHHECPQCGHIIDVLDVAKDLSVDEVAEKTASKTEAAG